MGISDDKSLLYVFIITMELQKKRSHLDRLRLMNLQLQMNQQAQTNTILMAQMRLNERRERRQAKKNKTKRKIWVRKWIQRRPQLGQYAKLMQELRDEDVKAFRNFLRLTPKIFREVLQRIEGSITKQDNNYREPLSPGLKLAITLRYLATGDSYHSLMYGFRVAHNTISKFIPEVCEAIIAEFGQELVPTPTKPEDWKNIAQKFSDRWNFHHCLGALDGKHIAMRCPKNGGSIFYNYKQFHSIILMALVDADYNFIWVDVGSNGSAGDAQVFNGTQFKDAIETGAMGFPPSDELPGDDRKVPYFIIGDDAFALRTWLMKPFSLRNMTKDQRIYNYRLSRARRIVENAFGIMSHRFRCLLTTLPQTTDTVTSITLCCVTLHNLLRKRLGTAHTAVADTEDADHNVVPGEWRKDFPLVDGDTLGGNRLTKEAKLQRNYLSAYYSSEAGSVPWQEDMI